MEVRDMLDILHYLFEEDLNVTSSEQIEAKSKVRDRVYRSIYNRDYKYSLSKSKTPNYSDFDSLDGYAGSPVVSNQTKPYMPPTNFDPDSPNPFGNILRETPLG